MENSEPSNFNLLFNQH